MKIFDVVASLTGVDFNDQGSFTVFTIILIVVGLGIPAFLGLYFEYRDNAADALEIKKNNQNEQKEQN